MHKNRYNYFSTTQQWKWNIKISYLSLKTSKPNILIFMEILLTNFIKCILKKYDEILIFLGSKFEHVYLFNGIVEGILVKPWENPSVFL